MTRDSNTGKGQYNCGYYSNAEVDKLVNAANEETDLEKRSTMLKKVEEILYNEAAFVPLHFQDPSWQRKYARYRTYHQRYGLPILWRSGGERVISDHSAL